MKRSFQSQYKTGLVYHSDMLMHRCLWDNNHVEVPERLQRSYNKCVERGLVNKCVQVEPRLATLEEIHLYHDPKYASIFTNCKNLDEEQLNSIAEKFDDVYVCRESYHAAMLSAGSTIEAVSAVLEKRCDNSMALVRPPGHHAMVNEANGFCFFNNVAIAAKKALQDYQLERILIVDWDVHHGQGTQRAFYNDPRVLYFSIHRFENGLFWPHLRESDWDYIGDGDGNGFNVNVPLNEINLGDSEYINIFLRVLMPMAIEFNPQLVLVSAGYDAAIGCPEGKMNVTPACYGHMTRMLMSLSTNGNVCVILEGGYCLESLEESVASTLSSLLGEPSPPLPQLTKINSCVLEVIYNVTYLLQNHWLCFRFLHSFLTSVSEKCDESIFTPKTSNYIGNPIKLNVYPTKNKYPRRDENEIEHFKKEITKIVAMYNFNCADYFVAVGYDKEVQNHFNRNADSLEGPYRLESVLKKLKRTDLLNCCNILPHGRQATQNELCLVHDLEYVNQLQSVNSDLLSFGKNSSDPTYVCHATFTAASYAVGVCLNVVDSVMTGESQSGFALVRPPGHHAFPSTGAKYCIFNNVSIAAKYAQTKYNVNKILIVDWGLDFGDGTSEIFANDDNVMFVSLYHQLFCSSSEANVSAEKIGKQNINISWKPSQNSVTDKDYIFAFFNILLPLAYSFSPDLIFVSAGFDAPESDDANVQISPWCFALISYLLRCLANGRVILILEEGYQVELLKESVVACLKSLLGVLPIAPIPSNVMINSEQLQTMAETACNLKNYWHLV